MIDFTSLRESMSTAFDTDRIVAVINLDGKTIASNIPCHFVITQADTVDPKEIPNLPIMPTTVFGTLYISSTPIIRAGYKIEIEKRTVDGTVVATYKTIAAMPSYTAGRLRVNLYLEEVKSGEEPPVALKCKFVDLNAYGNLVEGTTEFDYELGREMNADGTMTDVFYFIDSRFKHEGNAMKVTDETLGALTLQPNTVPVWKNASTTELFMYSDYPSLSPTKNVWYMPYKSAPIS